MLCHAMQYHAMLCHDMTYMSSAARGHLWLPHDAPPVGLPLAPDNPGVHVYMQVGMRGYLATRQMLLAGCDAVNINGGFRSWQTQFKALYGAPAPKI